MQKTKMDVPLHFKILRIIQLMGICSFIIISQSQAEPIQVLNNAWKDLPVRIESTNLNAQNYAWQLELSPQPNQQIQVKLLNPHPQLSVLNTRALNMAREIKLAQLPKIDTLSNKTSLNSDEKNLLRTHFYYGKYILIIKFPRGTQYSIKPNFKTMNDELQHLCDEQIRKQKGLKIKPNQNQQLLFNTRLSIDVLGQIQSIQFLPELDQKTTEILFRQLKKAKFLPHNQYGIPMSSNAEQPLIIQCNK